MVPEASEAAIPKAWLSRSASRLRRWAAAAAAPNTPRHRGGMEARKHVRDRPDPQPGPGHRLVADDHGLQERQTRRAALLGHCQRGGNHHRAGMVDGLLVHVVELEGVGCGAVGEGGHGRRRRLGRADHRAGSAAAGGQGVAGRGLRPRLLGPVGDRAQSVDHAVAGRSNVRGGRPRRAGRSGTRPDQPTASLRAASRSPRHGPRRLGAPERHGLWPRPTQTGCAGPPPARRPETSWQLAQRVYQAVHALGQVGVAAQEAAPETPGKTPSRP